MDQTPRQAADEAADPAGPTPPPPAPRRRWLRVARLAMLAAVLGLIAWYVWRHAGDFAALGELSPASLAAALGLDAMIYVYSAAAIILTVHLFGPRVAAGEAVLLALMTRFGNILLPLRGGAVARAVYLRKRHGLSYTHFLAGLSAMLLAMLAVCLGVALVGLVAIGLTTGRFFPWVTTILAGALAALAMTVVLRPRLVPSSAERLAPGKRGQGPFRVPGRGPDNAEKRAVLAAGVRLVRAQGQRLLDGYHLVSRHVPSLLGMIAAGGLHVATLAGVYAVLLAGMGKPADLGLLVVIVAIANVTTVAQITPGNVGVLEGVTAILGSRMGLSETDLLAATLAWRALDTAMILVVGPVSSYVLTGSAWGQRSAGDESAADT